jgi:hypothetical protein
MNNWSKKNKRDACGIDRTLSLLAAYVVRRRARGIRTYSACECVVQVQLPTSVGKRVDQGRQPEADDVVFDTTPLRF